MLLDQVREVARINGIHDVDQVTPGWRLSKPELIPKEGFDLLVFPDHRDDNLDGKLRQPRKLDEVDLGDFERALLVAKQLLNKLPVDVCVNVKVASL